MLLGRGEEQARIDALLADARRGISRALIIRGEPGIGKSALLSHAADHAGQMAVLAATGVESESELPFAGLSELLGPVLKHLGSLAEPQASALAGALAIGPPAAQDPFAISAATLSLVAAAAEQQPILAIIDDAHWIDSASRDALLFAARRLRADRVAMLFAVREGEVVALRGSGMPELSLSGLNQQASRDLLERAAGRQVPAGVAERIHAMTGGNPLAIVESLRRLSAAQLEGRATIDEPLQAGPEIQRAFERRIATLRTTTQQALLVAATSQSGSIDEIRRATRALGAELGALEGAEEAGLISNDGLRIQFRHPLMRTAVYYRATPAARRTVHRALADALQGQDFATERAWHLAAAAQGEDETVASSLEEAARESRRRGANGAASRAFERSARLSTDRDGRARRLHEAGSDAYIAGEAQRSRELLQEARTNASELTLLADIELTRGRVEMWTRSPTMARKILVSAADQVEPHDPARAALMSVDAAATCMMEPDPDEGLLRSALRMSQRAYELSCRTGGIPMAAAGGLLGKVLVALGRGDEAYPLLLQCLTAIDQSMWFSIQLIQCAAVFIWLEEYDRARKPLEQLIASARATGSVGALPYALGHLSELDFRTGRWASASAEAAEAAGLGIELGHKFSATFALAMLAWVDAARGRETDCRDHLAQALELSGPGVNAGVYSTRILGLLELGLGRPADALKHLKRLDQALDREGAGEASIFMSTPDLIEASVQLGQRAEASERLAAYEKQAERTQRTWALATAARCRGLLEQDFEVAFEEALRWHDRTPTPFERARTELCYGERLRRAKRRADARERLHSALETFERLGATCWENRCLRELRATGETARTRDRVLTDELTLQELQIALKVAEGGTNREVAAALFLSPKTVESHLSHIYSKLDLRSRTELARHFAQRLTPAVAVAVD